MSLMKITPQITFRNLRHSDAIERDVLSRIDDLEKYDDKITSCRVVIESPHHHHHKGNLYHVRIDIRLPGTELVVNRDSDQDHAHEDVYVAIRDAFEAMERQLKKYINRRRQDVKHHEDEPFGTVTKIFSDKGYGFFETPDGREIYFHKNSLLDGDISNVEVGNRVQFVEEQGEKGPQASSLHVIR